MSTVTVKRAPRADGPPLPAGQVLLAEPPVLPEPATPDIGSTLGFLPMALGAGTMGLMFSVAHGSPTTYLMSGMMGASMISMGAGQLSRSGLDRKRRGPAERRAYLRYPAPLRKQAAEAGAEEPAAALAGNPDPRGLGAAA